MPKRAINAAIWSAISSYKNPWIDTKMIYFAIVYSPRCGSNYLAELLDSSGEITCHTAVFNPHSTYLSRQHETPYVDKDTRDRDPWAFLSQLIADANKSKAFGFKIGLYDLRFMLFYILFCRRVRKIVLYRKDFLAAYASSQRANASGEWVRKGGSNSTSVSEKIYVQPKRLALYIIRRKLFYGFVRMIEVVTRQQCFWLAYEDLTTSSGHSQIADFLGAGQAAEFRAGTTKQNAQPLRDQIENFDQLVTSKSWRLMVSPRHLSG